MWQGSLFPGKRVRGFPVVARQVPDFSAKGSRLRAESSRLYLSLRTNCQADPSVLNLRLIHSQVRHAGIVSDFFGDQRYLRSTR